VNYSLDEKMVRRACAGDSEAFGHLVEQHYQTVYGVAFSAVGQWAAAEDIAQETFLQAWAKRETLRSARAFSAWVRRIARNLGVNWIESAMYRRRLADRYRTEIPQDAKSTPAPDVECGTLERRADIWEALNHLSGPVREAIVLFYLRGKSVREVSASLEISENAAKKRLQKGRARLRDYFEREWQRELRDTGEGHPFGSARERFLAGVALGPALPEMSAQFSGWGLALWWESSSNGILQNALTGGIVMYAKKTIAAGVILVLGVATLFLARFGGREDPVETTPTVVDLHEELSTKAGTVAKKFSIPGGGKGARGDSVHPSNFVDEHPFDPSVRSAITSPRQPIVTPNRIEKPDEYAWVSGNVVDGNNRPVPGVEVMVAALGLSRPAADEKPAYLAARRVAYDRFLYAPEHYWTSYTDASGAFLLEGIAYEGLAIVTARPPDHIPAMQSVRLSPGEGVTGVLLLAKPGATVYGHLLSAAGRPVDDAAVKLAGFFDEDGAMGEAIGAISFTDKEGRFDFAMESAGVASLVAKSKIYGDATFSSLPVEPGGELELRYEAGAVVFGAVTSADGEPVHSVEVRLGGWVLNSMEGTGGSATTTMTGGATYSAITNAQGTYRIDDVSIGQQYDSKVFGEGGRSLGTGSALQNMEAGGEYELNIVLRAPMQIRGTVTATPSGNPAPGIAVLAIGLEGGAGGRAVSRENGHYAIDLTGDGGTFEIRADYNRMGSRGGELVTLPTGRTTDDETGRYTREGPGDSRTGNPAVPDGGRCRRAGRGRACVCIRAHGKRCHKLPASGTV
jgi:RNA polymerase sigma factor (sigma-70 family)